MLALCVAALVIGMVVAALITRQIIRSLGAEPAAVKELAEAVGRGELFHQVRLRPGDVDSIMATLAKMTETLRATVTGVRRAAEGVADTSNKIAQGNQDLSARTEQQAASLEKTAASMDQLGSTVKQNAGNAQQANQLAQGAQQGALKGGELVGQVVETMKGINEGSRRISDIIGLIDSIAFQTNILALNASVEAAREIKNLITASVDRVEQGTALVDEAGATRDDIVSAIKRVTDIMGEISTASAEQSRGVTQVSVAVAEMDQATQQNAGQAEQGAAHSESLRVQAQELVQAVAAFRLEQERTGLVASRA
jgi:methyl-accepting chemotaxis protein